MGLRLDENSLGIIGKSVDLEQVLKSLGDRSREGGVVDVDDFYQLAREHLIAPPQPCTNWTFEDVGEQIWPLFETEPSTGRPIRRAMYEDDQYAARCSAKWSWQSKCLEKAGVNLVRDHFQAINEAGSRVMIGSFLSAAMACAQEEIRTKPTLESTLLINIAREDVPRPLCFFTVPGKDLSAISVDVSPSWSLTGSADYVVCVTSTRCQGFRTSSSPMGEFAAMLTVIKARGPHNLGEGRDEVLANAVALMTRTERTSVVAVLTNGQRWEFNVVTKSPEDRLFTCKSTTWYDASDEPGFVVQLLVNAILHPAEEFETRLEGDPSTA